MCTVTIVPRPGGFRLVCNRDELRTRPRALPPVVCDLGPVQAISPIDPHGGGTWIAVNSAGIVFALLNRTAPGDGRHEAPTSRGRIIPALLPLESMPAVVGAARALPLLDFAPFTLVVADEERLVVVRNVGAGAKTASSALTVPVMFTSSSLGDHLVIGPRRRLFTRMVAASSSPLAGQRAFHRHQWRDRPEVSVLMSRQDATTVSRTTVDVGDDGIAMKYTAVQSS
jgi:hypothetical protein